jgi:hypothetical protein
MKTHFKKLATATMMLLAVATVQARPIALPDPAATSTETGTFVVNAKNQITLTGNHLVLTTSTANGDIASGTARFMSGDLQYNDGASSVDGKIAKTTFASEIKGGQIVYMIKGQVFGTLTQAGKKVDVGGNFSLMTKPAAVGTKLTQTTLDASHLMLTIRSNVNNTQPVNTRQQRSHAGSHLRH